MGGAAVSRKMVTRAWWLGMASDEESRAYLQSRLVVLSQLMFWSYGALLVMMFLLYERYPLIEPAHNNKIYGLGVFGMAFLVVIWRGWLVRRPLTMRGLYIADIIYAAFSGTIFAASTLIAFDKHMAMTANILWVCLCVFLRTIVVPSTGERTAIISSIVLAPSLAAAAILPSLTVTEFPRPALIGSTMLVAAVLIAIATIGSRLIYGLRLKANAAMRLGRYTLDSRIGEGGNGAVYRAHHELLRRPTAIKLMRPDKIDADTLDRFEREVQHMSQLTHPNTVAVFDYGRSPDGVFYYAMEYLDGIDLENLVAKYGAQPGDRAIAILTQVCGALQEAHNRGIVHRDIKPANIILCERGDVPDVAKVVDFGLVKEIAASGDPNQTGRIFGTPSYLAPESMTAPDLVGPASDLYALGAVGYFLVTGKPVFAGKNALDVCIQHATAIPVPPSQHAPSVSPELEALLLRCLSKEPKDRPSSARELAALLRAVPVAGTWGEAEATQWWRDLKAGPSLATSTTGTMTITVDIAAREPDENDEPVPRAKSRVSRRA
ncbi:MAG: serine/threonine protein kinase [Myxococcota bacterium]|nr:serine/threonine protein kinase [Myxococcota bacterium]